MRLIKFFLILLISALYSCTQVLIPHQAQVADPYEPVLLKNKKDLQVSLGFRPFKYLYGDIAYAPVDHLALRANLGGFWGLANTSASAIYFNSIKRLNYFIGPIYNFQSNHIDHAYGDITGTFYRSYDYSCVYHSPGAVCGFSFGSESKQHHFNVRGLYNIVSDYNYSFLESDRYTATIDESLSYKIPNFFSIEPSYSLIRKMNKHPNRYFKIQFGFNFTEKTLKHHYISTGYTFYGYYYRLEKVYYHPMSFPFNFGLSYIFCSNRG